MSVIYKCASCKIDIKLREYHLKRYKGPFCCSRRCRGDLLRSLYRGRNNPNHKHFTELTKLLSDRTKAIRQRALKNKIPFNLSDSYLLRLYNLQNGLCKYTGIPLQPTTQEFLKKGQPDLDVISVDRINPELGYVEGNIALCCNGINKLKGNSNFDEFNNLLVAIALKSLNVCTIKYKIIREGALGPFKANVGDAGYDLFAAKIEDLGEQIKVYTGIAIQPSAGWATLIYPRSSITKRGLSLGNSVGVVDNGYTGEIIAIFNKIDKNAKIEVGDRVIQLVPLKMPYVEFSVVDDLSETDRGCNGFGASGI